MAETLIIIASILVAIMGIGVATWSIMNTRKRHYEDYLRRKRSADH